MLQTVDVAVGMGCVVPVAVGIAVSVLAGVEIAVNVEVGLLPGVFVAVDVGAMAVEVEVADRVTVAVWVEATVCVVPGVCDGVTVEEMVAV